MNIASLATKYRTENPFWEIQKDEFLVSGMVFNFIPINDTENFKSTVNIMFDVNCTTYDVTNIASLFTYCR